MQSNLVKMLPRRGNQALRLLHSRETRWLENYSPFKTAQPQVRIYTATSLDWQRFTSKSMAPLHGCAAAASYLEDEDHEADPYLEKIASTLLSQLLKEPEESFHLEQTEKVTNAENSEPRSLALELGEDNKWDDPVFLEELEQTFFDDPKSFEEYSHRSRRRSAVELLSQFDPLNPPSSDNLEDVQLWLECEAQQEAVLRYQKALDSARDQKDYSRMSLLQQQIMRWLPRLTKEIETRQFDYLNIDVEGEARVSLQCYGPLLCVLPAQKMAVIAAQVAVLHCLLKSGHHGQEGVSYASMVLRIGNAIEEELVIHKALYNKFGRDRSLQPIPNTALDNMEAEETLDTQDDYDTLETNPLEGPTHRWGYAASHLKTYLAEIQKRQPSLKKRRLIQYAVRKAREALESDEEWTERQKIQVGAALMQMLLDTATIHDDGKEAMVFTYEKKWMLASKLKAFIVLNDAMYRMLVSDKMQSFAASTTRYKPMVVPPDPWTNAKNGGYLWLKADLMRYHGCNTQKEALEKAELSTIFDGLNALGRVRWKINERILDAAKQCWESNIPLGEIPSRTDYELPPEPIPPNVSRDIDGESPLFKEKVEEKRRYREALTKYKRVKQKNMDLRSLRCSAMLKLDQAEKFKNFDELYFPYNMDFRGRAYPVPPHLSNVGSDLCRGMLKFADAKPLGKRGLYWLKVHLANFAGKDKMTFDDRANFIDEHMTQVRDSAERPFEGERWWMQLEDPFQGLATCMEIVDAIDSGDPESFMCSLPVHMDGSCNGLQHYAALGRDMIGGKAVNLCAIDEPQDVYVGVMHEVIRRVAEEAERSLEFDASSIESLSKKQLKELKNNRAAKLVNGLVDRGVVKRTVMTSVYGVTYIGARQQIQEKIESKLEAQGHDIDEIQNDVFHACGYLANVTMSVIGDLFSGAKDTMNWLTACARLIAQEGHPVAWISPIGLPAIQPYRQKKYATLVTLRQAMTLTDESDNLPIHKQKQVSAFPPNFVHSLDSSHMLLTAIEMDRRGLSFSAVHDSFWTHACDVDEMNAALRDVFIELYRQPLLENLKKTWELRYPELEFPELPKRGKLDLNEVRRAKYFFQ